MNQTTRVLFSFGIGIVLGVFVSCQTYDFQPIQPLGITQTRSGRKVSARRQKPNVMLVVDKSGSMKDAINGGTKWSELQVSMTQFLQKSGTTARMGMVTFPSDATCGTPSSFRTPPLDQNLESNELLQDNANKILGVLQGITTTNQPDSNNYTVGGTPTALTLEWVRNNMPDDPNRDDFVLLLTDGLPNCHEDLYKATGGNLPCDCGQGACNPATGGLVFCKDKLGTVDAIKALAAKNIRTLVIGFGADTSQQDATATLNAMAQAGGFPLSCPNGTDAECGDSPSSPNKCNGATKQCSNRFYFQASNSSELSTILNAVTDRFSKPCEFRLTEPPADNKFMAVLVDGQSTPAGADTWKYDAVNGLVLAQGALCQRLENSTDQKPIDVEIRYVDPL